MGLTKAGRALRIAHIAIAVVETSCLGYVWVCALTGRRGKALWAAVGLLAVEGIALVIGRGNCPLGPLQERVGDPVPLFELVLPPRAAKAAVPALAAISVIGIVVVVARPRPTRAGSQPSTMIPR